MLKLEFNRSFIDRYTMVGECNFPTGDYDTFESKSIEVTSPVTADHLYQLLDVCEAYRESMDPVFIHISDYAEKIADVINESGSDTLVGVQDKTTLQTNGPMFLQVNVRISLTTNQN